MSRTIRGCRPPGYEYWKSRLHPCGELPGRVTKKLTHKKERRVSKQIAETSLNQYYREEGSNHTPAG